MKPSPDTRHLPSISVHVAEPGARVINGAVRCEVGRDIKFSTESLESYFFAEWNPVAYDALLVAAAVEFADRTKVRPALDWSRTIQLKVPVHDIDQWQEAPVRDALHDALAYLTGDTWDVTFYRRKRSVSQPRQAQLSLPTDVEAVIPFSNGLDSRAVGGLMERSLGNRLVRIRLGGRLHDSERVKGRPMAFTDVPYKVTGDFVESSARSRGFKFALISGIAAYLSGAAHVIVPESGQRALGPALVPVGQTYEDYRSHPTFTVKMERLFKALFARDIRFSFPQLWNTKGETLRRFIQECGDRSWLSTKSCWQQSRQIGIGGGAKKRQCGICAACMLRRMSVHAAGAVEPSDQYVWENLGAATFEQGVVTGFPPGRITGALRQYAIAGTLHLDHLADLNRSGIGRVVLDVSCMKLGEALAVPREEVRVKMDRFIQQHTREWSDFVLSLGDKSFINNWAEAHS